MIYRSMQHLSISLGIIAFGTGIASLMMIRQFYKNYKYQYLKTYFKYVIILNIFTLINLIFHYFLTNVLNTTGDHSKVLLIFAINIFGFYIFTLLTYLYINFTREITEAEYKGKTGLFLLLLAVAASLGYGFAIGSYLSELKAGLFLIFYKIFITIPLLLSIIASIILFINSRKLKIRSHISKLRIFSLIYAVFYIFQILLWFVPFKTTIVISTFNLFIYNVIPILFLKYFVQNYEKAGSNEKGANDNIAVLYRKYGLSDRESEIADLLATGKSNEEIENELFISIFTVKKHISNIFSKIGVRSRSQFMKLIFDEALKNGKERL